MRSIKLLLTAVLLSACGETALTEPTPPAPQGGRTPRILYVTHSAGFTHQVLPLSEQILGDVGRRTRAFESTATKDVAVMSVEGLREYDGIVFYTTGELPISDGQKQALLDFVRGGKGFIGIHSATDTFYNWPEYGEMIGGYFDGHPWHQEVRVRVEDAQHPAASGLQDGLTIRDEIYQFKNWSRDRVHVILSLDPASVDLTKSGVNRTDRDFALSWTRNFGNGRVFYTALGHEPDLWRDTRFQEHLAGGIRWALSGGR